MTAGRLRSVGHSALTPHGEPALTEEETHGAFADDDADRIVGLDMCFEPLHPPAWVRRLWEVDAKYDPLPPGSM